MRFKIFIGIGVGIFCLYAIVYVVLSALGRYEPYLHIGRHGMEVDGYVWGPCGFYAAYDLKKWPQKVFSLPLSLDRMYWHTQTLDDPPRRYAYHYFPSNQGFWVTDFGSEPFRAERVRSAK